MKSRAAVAFAAGEPLQIVELDVEPPKAGEVVYVHAPRSPGGALFNMFDSFF